LPAPRELPAHVAATEPLSPSGVEAFRTCPESYHIAYELAVKGSDYNSALSIGSAFGAGAEQLLADWKSGDVALQLAAVSMACDMARALKSCDEDRRETVTNQALRDGARVATMLRGWWRHWTRARQVFVDGPQLPWIEAVATEHDLAAPLLNPETTAASRTFHMKGRCDAIVKLPDASPLYIYELKTTSDTLDDVESYLRHGVQVSAYQAMASWMWPGVDWRGCVIDICKKPVIKQRKTGKTGKTAETLEQYQQRCLDAYADEPDRYFRRVLLDWDEGAQVEARAVWWRVAEALRASRRWGYLAVRGLRCKTALGWCRYRGICWFGDAHGFAVDNDDFDGGKKTA